MAVPLGCNTNPSSQITRGTALRHERRHTRYQLDHHRHWVVRSTAPPIGSWVSDTNSIMRKHHTRKTSMVSESSSAAFFLTCASNGHSSARLAFSVCVCDILTCKERWWREGLPVGFVIWRKCIMRIRVLFDDGPRACPNVPSN